MEEQLYLFIKRFKGVGYSDFMQMPLKLRRFLWDRETKVLLKEKNDAESNK